MLLKNRNAIIYGAGGAVGSTIARAYAREGARLFLVGRTLAKVEAVARDIISDGGAAEAAQVDALDEQAIERHATEVVRKAGRLDISFNAVGIPADVVAKNGMHGVPFTEITLESSTYLRHSLPYRIRSTVCGEHRPKSLARRGRPPELDDLERRRV